VYNPWESGKSGSEEVDDRCAGPAWPMTGLIINSHEDNFGLYDILAGARADERKVAAKKE
jgi:hypothetical protein